MRRQMASDLKRCDPVEWHSEAGSIRGTFQKKVTWEITLKGKTMARPLPKTPDQWLKEILLAWKDAKEAKPFARLRH